MMKRLLGFTASLLLGSTAFAADAPVPAAPAGVTVEPPKASMGATYCDPDGTKRLVVWVILANGKIIRMDKDHKPKTPEETKAFLEWLDTGPTDLFPIPCPVST